MASLPATVRDLRRPATWPIPARAVLVGFGYLLAGWASLNLQLDDGTVVPIWLASGVALAGVLAWGPWMAVGAFVADLFLGTVVSGLPVLVATGVAAGDTIEVVVAAWITHAIGETIAFSHTRCVIGMTIAAPTAAIVSASVAIVLLSANGHLILEPDRAWFRYWLSTISGMLLVTPLLLTWLRTPWRRLHPRRMGEATLLGVSLAASTWAVFVRTNWTFLELLVVLPLFTWAVIRFGTRGATAATAIFGTVLAYGILERNVALAGAGVSETADIMQVLVLLVGFANLIVAAALTERHEAIMRLRELVDTFDQSQRIAHVGSWELRLDGERRVWCSAELRRMLPLECEPDDMCSLDDLLATVHHLDRRQLTRIVEPSLASGDPFEFEHRVADAPRRILRHVAAVVPAEDDGNGRRIVGSVLDVTEARALERFQSDLVATASHELRTPLTSILGFADTLARSWDQLADEQRQAFVGIIDEQARRLDRIVAETLLQTKVDAGAVGPSTRGFLLGRSARRVVDRLSMDDVELDLAPGTMAVGDPDQLEQVLENLLTNARKYGEPPIAVRVRERGDGRVELRVEDHGPGLAPSFGPRAFDRFARGPDVGTAPGTGLGLSIARGLVEAVGGSIHHERWNGVTSFVVRLPADRRARPRPEEERDGHGAERNRGSTSSSA